MLCPKSLEISNGLTKLCNEVKKDNGYLSIVWLNDFLHLDKSIYHKSYF